ncbi:MAG: NAD-dependent epimerase/dehydratase family protein [Actinomycetota bacterium]|nr:NAD-dependent epimerase/dehydratase family protein [Actinomycetota bacterium]
MRLLVLGGTVFLSKAVAEDALRRGHDVTCACRGESGSVPGGAAHVAWDRDQAVPPELSAEASTGGFDAVVDVARHPSRVRSAVTAFPGAHWVFVSTINVYSDESTPGGRPDTLPLHEPIATDEDPSSGSEVYGAMKVACEQIVQEGAVSATVVRPGLIVGPGDPSGRYTYWPDRLAETTSTDQVLAPGSPDDVVQIIDVRDLASWIVDCAEARTVGAFDGTGPSTRLGDVLAETAAGVAGYAELVWADQDFLQGRNVEPWMGDRSIPLWLPRPAYDGMMDHDLGPSFAAGLTTRPIADTARDTLAWTRSEPSYPRTGLTLEEEADLLSAWRQSDDRVC